MQNTIHGLIKKRGEIAGQHRVALKAADDVTIAAHVIDMKGWDADDAFALTSDRLWRLQGLVPNYAVHRIRHPSELPE